MGGASDPLALASADDLAAELLRRTRMGEGWDPALAGELFMALEPAADHNWNRFSRKRLADLFVDPRRFPGGHDLDFRGATVLEVGSGAWNPFASLMVYLQLGAMRGIAVDVEEVVDLEQAARGAALAAAYTLLDPRLVVDDYPVSRREVACNSEALDFARLREGDPSGAGPERLAYRRESIHALSLDDAEVDLSVSTSFLEHVDRVEAAIAQLARVTKVGGYGVHGIDGTDHRRYAHPEVSPLEFLCEEPEAEILHGSNRLRPLQFVDLFAAHGFDVLDVRPWFDIEISDDLRSRMVEPYRSLSTEVLRWGAARLFVRRR